MTLSKASLKTHRTKFQSRSLQICGLDMQQCCKLTIKKHDFLKVSSCGHWIQCSNQWTYCHQNVDMSWKDRLNGDKCVYKLQQTYLCTLEGFELTISDTFNCHKFILTNRYLTTQGNEDPILRI